MRRLPLLLLLLLGLGLGGQPQPDPPLGAQCLEHDCFGIFWESHPFVEASAACEKGGGHLMTVRSTVAEDAIAVLLQNRSGRLWLGLRLSHRCPDPAQRLRGFQWVTGDGRTDYSNWEPSTGLRGCGERCVTVSRELRWEERMCQEPADGFLCEYNYRGSCPHLPPVEGLLVTYATPFGVRGGDFQALPPGSVALIPAMGLELLCDEAGDSGGLRWGRGAPGAWPCRLANGGCEAACGEEGGGGPHCSCPDGKVLAPDGRGCSSPCAGAPCQHHCVVADSSFVCMCEEGYQLAADGSSCKDIDDCATVPRLCEQVCVNTLGGFECRCHHGYEMVEERCQPISRCQEAPCEQQCEDVAEGDGYRCSCSIGYAVDPRDPSRCYWHCNDSQCPAECNKYGQSCECPEGFILDEGDKGQKVCVDLDECNMDYCEHNCTNHPGGYQCHCQDGYRLRQKFHCIKILPGAEEGAYSGDFGPQSPIPSRTPPKVGHLHPGVLVGVAVGALSAALALLALGYHLVKKCCRPPATMDYKCSGPHEKEMGLQPVASSCAT
ncbi:TRBM protein, partial [Hemiprocne comata]|nr:TRBM protein [Hemiprocne comata]